ncbi:MAG: hypothetical protein ACREHF_08180 [Rhizomicrobium sp.]
MEHRTMTLLLATAVVAALGCAGADAHGTMGGRGAGGFMHFGGFHRHPVAAGFARFRFGRSFRGFRFGRPYQGFRFRSFPESSETVAGDDDMYDYDTGGFGYDEGDLADMHFRVEDSFGPWDVGLRPPPPDYASGPWEDARMDPWHGYEPQDW